MVTTDHPEVDFSTEEYPAVETGLDIQDGDGELRGRFGGVCNECETAMDCVDEDEFARIGCPDCGIVIGPVMSVNLEETTMTDVASDSTWPKHSTLDHSEGNVTIRSQFGGRCNCGQSLVTKTSRFDTDVLCCPDCAISVSSFINYNVLSDRNSDG